MGGYLFRLPQSLFSRLTPVFLFLFFSNSVSSALFCSFLLRSLSPSLLLVILLGGSVSSTSLLLLVQHLKEYSRFYKSIMIDWWYIWFPNFLTFLGLIYRLFHFNKWKGKRKLWLPCRRCPVPSSPFWSGPPFFLPWPYASSSIGTSSALSPLTVTNFWKRFIFSVHF